MNDYLNINEDILKIENDLDYLTTEISKKVNFLDSIESIKYENDSWKYQKNAWIKGQPIWLENIDMIERTINYLSINFYRPLGWEKNKVWIQNNNVIKRNISNGDVFRWKKDLSLLKNNIDNVLYLYNSKTQNFVWNEWTDIEWSEING